MILVSYDRSNCHANYRQGAPPTKFELRYVLLNMKTPHIDYIPIINPFLTKSLEV
jgi:hypothetical protein